MSDQQHRQQERNYSNLEKLNNTGFDSLDTDLYSLLNLSHEASIKQIVY